ncbi:MAG: fructokinase [Sphingobium sp. SCN 64-10]|nr:MAG: fructokinase [Sphingobium sp. SCN 64-10]
MPGQGRFAGVELGGTKTIALLAKGDEIVERLHVDTRAPGETLAAINAQLHEWDAVAPLDAVGIASFGPIQLRRNAENFGHMLDTPKAGWAGADVAGLLTRGLACPIALDTDVNGAVLAEHLWGAGRGIDPLWYITVGTGLGGGLLLDGRPVHGAMHPEIGHIRVRRSTGERFDGACPFHGDCIEGLVSGPALARRFGVPVGTVSDEDPRWASVADDLAELMATLFLTTAAERILLGGTVMTKRSFLIPMIRAATLDRLAGYLPFVRGDTIDGRIMLAALGDEAGPMGAIALAMSA